MSEQMRKEFEKVAERGHLDLEIGADGYYINCTTCEFWHYWVESWKASKRMIKQKAKRKTN